MLTNFVQRLNWIVRACNKRRNRAAIWLCVKVLLKRFNLNSNLFSLRAASANNACNAARMLETQPKVVQGGVQFLFPTSRWSVTSLRGPGERNFNAVSHKPKLTGTDWIGARVCLWGTTLKFLSPGPRNDVTDHLANAQTRLGRHDSHMLVSRIRV